MRNISVAQWKSAWPITRKPKDRNLAEITGFCGVMVSTLDFESNDPGSNPGRTFLINIININNILVRVAQWIERLTSNQKVAGSSPVMDIFVRFPESGQRGATQVRMQYASRVQIPHLTSPC